MLGIALIGNLVPGSFKLGFTGQPIAHSDGLWNLLGMMLGGWGFALLGGCPLSKVIYVVNPYVLISLRSSS